MTMTGASIKRIILCFLFATALLLISGNCVSAEEVYTFSDESVSETRINMQIINGENTIVLPSSVKPDSVILYGDFEDRAVIVKGALKAETFSSGNKMNLNDFCKDGEYILTFSDKNKIFADFTVRFLFSENIPAVFLVSDNPQENGRLWVEEPADKSNKATGNIVMQKENGEIVHSGALTQIKGRGNSTWMQVKKPYQIKTDKKVDLLETGDDNNKSKTWLLLANYMDQSLLSNSIVLSWGKSMGMRTNIESTPVDLYYDGEYRGNYLLAEKVELGDGRVSITDLEEKNEEANEGTDIEKLPIGSGKTKNGATFTYCENMASPDDITGGYLLEMDYESRAKEEVCYFCSTRGQYVVVKSPEYASREEMEYIATLYQEYEDAVYNGGKNPATGKMYTDYVDADSLASYYLLNEFSKARDFFQSSAYLHKDAGEEKMYMGPLWDYDQSFISGKSDKVGEHPRGASIHNADFGVKLVEIESFRALLKTTYKEKMLPVINSNTWDSEIETLKASADINALMWYPGTKWETKAEALQLFIKERTYYMADLLNKYPEENYSDCRFKDVFPLDWFYGDVNKTNSLGFMNGISKDYFDPYSNVKRSEIAQVLYNIKSGKKAYSNINYSDVTQTDWFYNAVRWVTHEKIMYGNETGEFEPDRLITREELVVCLYKYKKEPKVNTDNLKNFADGSEVSSRNAMEWAINNNIILGDTHQKLNPKTKLTRAELAAILVRFNKVK